MKTIALLTTAVLAALMSAFVGALVGFFIGFVSVLAFGVALASLPLFGAGGAAAFAVWGAYKAVRRASEADGGVVAADWAADDVVEDGPAFDEDYTGMMLPPGQIPGPTDTPAGSRRNK